MEGSAIENTKLRSFLERFKKPDNHGVIEGADVVSEEADYSCGDRVRIYLKFKGNVIIDAKFTSEACLFCKASASILMDAVKGKTIEGASRIREDELLGFFNADRRSPRYRCIILPLKALRKALQR